MLRDTALGEVHLHRHRRGDARIDHRVPRLRAVVPDDDVALDAAEGGVGLLEDLVLTGAMFVVVFGGPGDEVVVLGPRFPSYVRLLGLGVTTAHWAYYPDSPSGGKARWT